MGNKITLLTAFWCIYAPYVFAAMTPTQDKYAPCLSYYTIGDTGTCNPEPEPEPKVAEVSPTIPAPEPKEEQPAAPQKRSLDERIKEYMADHGKPPKEYVAFYLEPTLDNAIKWVHTYNEILERNKRITYAWGQAEKLYDTAKAAGQDVSILNNPEDGEVVDFGIEVDGYTRPEGLPFPEGDPRNTPQTPTSPQNTTLGGITVPTPPNPTPGLPTNLNPNLPLPSDDILPPPEQAFAPRKTPPSPTKSRSIGTTPPTEITYYFSADCPYCQRFEPGFNAMIASLDPNKYSVTCVDMTPTGAKQTNINGKVDCAWRPPGLGETEKLGIKKTPSVTIKRPSGGPLERVVGYVEPERLKAYLTTGSTE